MSIEKYIATVIEREGGYVDHPDDKGGPTKYGITLKTLVDWRKAEVTAQDVKDLKIEEAYTIFKTNYLVAPGIINISDYKLQALMLDAAINHGASRAIRFLQQALTIKDDGIIGPVTIQFANAATPMEELRRKYMAMRIRFYGAILDRDHTQIVFAHGWLNRCGELLETVA